MKVFFTGSPRALKTYKKEHEAIYAAIEKAGGTNLSSLVIKADPDKFYQVSHEDEVKHFNVTMDHVQNADIVCAEVTTHSMSMGYIINKTLELNKPAIVLHLPGFKPFFFRGINNEKLLICEYTAETADKVIGDAFDYVDTRSDVRFNFYLSSAQANFIEQMGKKENESRSSVLRMIIAKEMERKN